MARRRAGPKHARSRPQLLLRRASALRLVGVVGRRPVAARDDVPLAGAVVARHKVQPRELVGRVGPVARGEEEVGRGGGQQHRGSSGCRPGRKGSVANLGN